MIHVLRTRKGEKITPSTRTASAVFAEGVFDSAQGKGFAPAENVRAMGPNFYFVTGFSAFNSTRVPPMSTATTPAGSMG